MQLWSLPYLGDTWSYRCVVGEPVDVNCSADRMCGEHVRHPARLALRISSPNEFLTGQSILQALICYLYPHSPTATEALSSQ